MKFLTLIIFAPLACLGEFLETDSILGNSERIQFNHAIVTKVKPTSTNLHTIAGWDSANDTLKQIPIDSLPSSILNNSCQPNDTTNRWGMNTQAKYGGRIVEAVDCDANLGNDTPMIWVERKHDGNWSGIGDPSTPVGMYVQHEQTGSGTAFTHSIMALGINSGSGDNDVIASSGRVIKRSGLGDACGVWGSAYDSTATYGGVMGLEGHIYQNVTGMVAKDTLGARWSAALHLYSGSLQSDALAGVAISSFAPAVPYRFWNGVLLDMDAFRRTGNDPVAGTVGLNMARATPYYGIKFGHCNKQIACTDSFKVGLSSGYYAYITSPQNSYLHLNGNGYSGLIVDAGIGPAAGNQNAFIDIKSNSVLMGNIAYTESDGKFSINSAVTTGLSLCSGGGITTIEKRAKVVGGLDLDSVPLHSTDSVLTANGGGVVGYRSMAGMKVDSARIAGSVAGLADSLITKKIQVNTAANGVKIDSTGLSATGTATDWEDLNFDPARASGPTATKPDEVTIDSCLYVEFTSANNQYCGAIQELPHSSVLSDSLWPHAHVFLKNGESAGTTGATFTISWQLRQTTGTTRGSLTVAATSAELSGNANIVRIDGERFYRGAELGGQLAYRIGRTAGDAGDVIVTTYGVHYKKDRIGSSTISSK